MSVENKIPKEWKTIPLGEVCKLKNGFAFKSTEYKSEGIPVIRISDIKDGLIVLRNTVRVSEKTIYNDYIINVDEILVAMSGATTGKFGIFKASEIAYQNQRVGKFDILNRKLLNNNFLLHQLHSLKRQIEKDAYGGAQPNISSKKIEEMQIVLPPLKAQQDIVSKIEELFSELDKGIENLKTAKQQLKTYRQAVLKWAFTGKLTNKRVKDGELPEGWKSVKLGEVSKVSGGLTKNAKRQNLKLQLPFLRVGNVYLNFLDLSDVHTIGINENEIERVKLEKDDLLFVEGNGSLEQIGRAALWDGSIANCVHQNHLIKARLLKQIIPKYALYFFCSKVGRDKIKEQANSTSGLHTLNLSKISNLEFPVCSEREQNLIIQEIESRLSVTDKMEESINQSLQQAEALRQSILKKAFEGKLINQ